jgi:hypothetical protein
MKRKVVLAATVLGLVMGALSITARPSYAIPSSWHLNVPKVAQPSGSNWCWAASLRSIMGYRGVWVSQCQIVEEGWNAPCWYFWPGWPDSVPQSVLSKHGFSNTLTGQISFTSIMNELYYSNRPIYVRVMYGVASGHAFVLSGYDTNGTNYVERMDPGDGNFHICTYDWLRNGGPCPDWGDPGHSWDATIRNIHN